MTEIMFGTPTPLVSKANLGTLKKDMVNIGVHGHNPVLSEIIVAVAGVMEKEAAAAEKAKEVIRVAIKGFGRRKGKPVDIPDIENTVVAGFSVESIVAALSKLDAQDPLKPLVDNIKNGNIRGVCLFAGCNNVKVPQDKKTSKVKSVPDSACS